MTTATKTHRLKKLTIKFISPREYRVQCASGQHVYHSVVKSASSSRWICDQACWQFRKHYDCTHVQRVIEELTPKPRITSLTPFELWQGDEYSTLEAGDGIVYDGSSCCYDYDAPRHDAECGCPCHSVIPVPPPVKKRTLESLWD